MKTLGRLNRRGLITGAGALVGSSVLGGCYERKQQRVEPHEVEADLFLSDMEALHGGRIGLAALDMQSARRINWRGQERFPFCSTFKPFLAAATLQRVERGEEELNRAVPITRADIVPHAPVTGRAVGRSLTVEQLMQATVELSDNTAANILIREMGGIAVWRRWWTRIGDTTTLVSRLETDLNTALPNDTRDTCLPDQMLSNMHLMSFSDQLSTAHEQMIQGWLLASPTAPGRLKAAAPEGWSVAHKSGSGDNGTANDIGILMPLSGAPVLMAVYYTGAEDALPEQLDAVVAASARRALEVLGRV